MCCKILNNNRCVVGGEKMKLNRINIYPHSIRLIYLDGKTSGKYVQIKKDVFEKHFTDMLSKEFEFDYVCKNYGCLWGFN